MRVKNKMVANALLLLAISSLSMTAFALYPATVTPSNAPPLANTEANAANTTVPLPKPAISAAESEALAAKAETAMTEDAIQKEFFIVEDGDNILIKPVVDANAEKAAIKRQTKDIAASTKTIPNQLSDKRVSKHNLGKLRSALHGAIHRMNRQKFAEQHYMTISKKLKVANKKEKSRVTKHKVVQKKSVVKKQLSQRKQQTKHLAQHQHKAKHPLPQKKIAMTKQHHKLGDISKKKA